MKLAAPFPLDENRKEIIDEYNIEYDPENHKLNDLIEGINKNSNKRINIKKVDSQGEDKELEQLQNLSNNIYFRLDSAQNVGDFKDSSYNFFLDDEMAINSFCRLYDMLELGVTDVYLQEDLCYKLKQVRELCNKYNAQIRIILNKIPNTLEIENGEITAPGYTPENLEELELYYDIAEFEIYNSGNRFDILYEVGFVDKEGKDSLKYIIMNMTKDIPGESFISNICAYRMNCGHRCVERLTHCQKCQQAIDLAYEMKEQGYEYDKENKKWVEVSKESLRKDI